MKRKVANSMNLNNSVDFGATIFSISFNFWS